MSAHLGLQMTDSPSAVVRACSGCGRKLKVPVHLAEKRVKCPGCGKGVAPEHAAQRVEQKSLPVDGLVETDVVHLPPRGGRRAAAGKSDDIEALVKRFQGDFPRPRVTLQHRLVALIVVLVMLVLPLIYLAMTAAIGWGTYWHLRHDWVWMSIPGGRTKVLAALAYGTVGIAGVLWFLSMLRPLFGLPTPAQKLTGLKREDEPLLFQFVDRLADIVKSPRPEVILLSPEVNASASFQTRFFGLMRQQFTLTLGLPLVAGLKLDQLAGVIAHEFGHFSQGGSTLLGRLIYQINTWFAKAVYERDVIDEMIDEMTESGSGGLALCGFLVWILVSIGRGVLWLLMMIGLFVSSALSRQMEFNADQYEVGVSGSERFQETSEQIVTLSLADQATRQFIMGSRDANHLPANYPAFVAGLAKECAQVRKKARKFIRKEKSHWMASHPPTRVRMECAERSNQPGIFNSQRSAGRLFRNFRERCEGLTLFLYFLRFGPGLNPDMLRPTEAALESYLETMGVRRE